MASTTRERRLAAKPKKKSKALLLWAVGVAVAVGVAFAAFRIFGKDDNAYDVDWPRSEPTGEPVVVVRALEPDSVFRTTVETQNRIALQASSPDPNRGMTFDAKLEVEHKVAPREGGGTRSTFRWMLVDATSNIPGKQSELWLRLGEADRALVVTQDRDAKGARLPAPAPAAPPGEREALQREALETLLSGFVDPTMSFLPAGRDVRVGEAWNLIEEVSDLAEMDRAVRLVTETTGEGFPVLQRAGVVKAEAVDETGGEKTLRLRVVFSITMEGDTRPPAEPGRVSLGGKGEGTVWVSLATGLPVSLRLDSTLRSTVRREGRSSVERAINQTIRASTTRP